jgi:hypothetical protein
MNEQTQLKPHLVILRDDLKDTMVRIVSAVDYEQAGGYAAKYEEEEEPRSVIDCEVVAVFGKSSLARILVEMETAEDGPVGHVDVSDLDIPYEW